MLSDYQDPTAVLSDYQDTTQVLTSHETATHAAAPVSYTHLDVYKRQVCDTHERAAQCAEHGQNHPALSLIHIYSDAGIDLEQEATSANGLPGEPIASEFAPVDVDEFAADDFDDLMQDDPSFADVEGLPCLLYTSAPPCVAKNLAPPSPSASATR